MKGYTVEQTIGGNKSEQQTYESIGTILWLLQQRVEDHINKNPDLHWVNVDFSVDGVTGECICIAAK